jgi:hypothetical protein
MISMTMRKWLAPGILAVAAAGGFAGHYVADKPPAPQPLVITQDYYAGTEEMLVGHTYKAVQTMGAQGPVCAISPVDAKEQAAWANTIRGEHGQKLPTQRINFFDASSSTWKTYKGASVVTSGAIDTEICNRSFDGHFGTSYVKLDPQLHGILVSGPKYPSTLAPPTVAAPEPATTTSTPAASSNAVVTTP